MVSDYQAVKLGVGRVLERQSELQQIKLGNKLKKKHFWNFSVDFFFFLMKWFCFQKLILFTYVGIIPVYEKWENYVACWGVFYAYSEWDY